MPRAHRLNDKRACDAVTIVQGQNSVYVNDRLWSVVGDPNNHGAGNLIGKAAGDTVYIHGINVIVNAPDPAEPDNQAHPSSATKTAEGSSNVYAYG